MMIFVLYGAAAMACVAPVYQFWRAGSLEFARGVMGRIGTALVVAVFEGIAIPVAWAVLSLVVVRRGVTRDNLVMSFLLAALSVAFMLMTFLMVAFQIPSLSRAPLGEALQRLVMISATLLFLGGGTVFLIVRLIKGPRTPSSHRTIDPAGVATGARWVP
jgi:hypothetical protein